MNNTLKITIIFVASLIGVAVLIFGGVLIGQNIAGRSSAADGWFPFNLMHRFSGTEPYGMMGRGFSGRYDFPNQPNQNYGFGRGMMNGWYSNRYDGQNEPDIPYGMGPGMMGGRFGFSDYTGQPLTVAQAKDAVDGYLADMGNDDLYIAEIMVFDQNAYTVVKEKSTGMGAMELLVDHATGSVFPEYGPNMMWNLKYSMMGSGRGRFGMGSFLNGVYSNNGDFKFDAMPVTQEEAQTSAQNYLDKTVPGAGITDEGFTFYGYYTFDYMMDGKTAGMLSVNGYSGDVWPHTWHGGFVQEEEFD